MSRIGKQPIKIPGEVKVTQKGKLLEVVGPRGILSLNIRDDIILKITEEELVVESTNRETTAYWGLTRSLIANAVKGVTEGYEKILELVGVGYRVKKDGNLLSLTLGFSHPVNFEVPDGIKLEVPDNKTIKVIGIDKQLVGLTAAKIRKLRKPEPYKGKGIKYSDEIVRRKQGKSLATA